MGEGSRRLFLEARASRTLQPLTAEGEDDMGTEIIGEKAREGMGNDEGGRRLFLETPAIRAHSSLNREVCGRSEERRKLVMGEDGPTD
jgi:hypothetical protein